MQQKIDVKLTRLGTQLEEQAFDQYLPSSKPNESELHTFKQAVMEYLASPILSQFKFSPSNLPPQDVVGSLRIPRTKLEKDQIAIDVPPGRKRRGHVHAHGMNSMFRNIASSCYCTASYEFFIEKDLSDVAFMIFPPLLPPAATLHVLITDSSVFSFFFFCLLYILFPFYLIFLFWVNCLRQLSREIFAFFSIIFFFYLF